MQKINNAHDYKEWHKSIILNCDNVYYVMWKSQPPMYNAWNTKNDVLFLQKMAYSGGWNTEHAQNSNGNSVQFSNGVPFLTK